MAQGGGVTSINFLARQAFGRALRDLNLRQRWSVDTRWQSSWSWRRGPENASIRSTECTAIALFRAGSVPKSRAKYINHQHRNPKYALSVLDTTPVGLSHLISVSATRSRRRDEGTTANTRFNSQTTTFPEATSTRVAD